MGEGLEGVGKGVERAGQECGAQARGVWARARAHCALLVFVVVRVGGELVCMLVQLGPRHMPHPLARAPLAVLAQLHVIGLSKLVVQLWFDPAQIADGKAREREGPGFL